MKLLEILEWLKAAEYRFEFHGNEETEIMGFSSLERCEPGKITWVKKQEKINALPENAIPQIAVVQAGLNLRIPNQIIAPNSKEVFFAILHHYWGTVKEFGQIGKGNVISEHVSIDPAACIGNNCSFIGNISIGANTIIENNVVICNSVTIGKDCIIHSGAVIGTDGYGYAIDQDGLPVKVEHFGGVQIGDRVEIGANTCIDRGTIDDTVLMDDVKLDNLVHVAHNVVIERGAMVVAGAIVCGSVHVGAEAYIAPGGIVKNQLSLGNGAFVGLGAVVTKPVDSLSVVAGVPAKKIRELQPGDK